MFGPTRKSLICIRPFEVGVLLPALVAPGRARAPLPWCIFGASKEAEGHGRSAARRHVLENFSPAAQTGSQVLPCSVELDFRAPYFGSMDSVAIGQVWDTMSAHIQTWMREAPKRSLKVYSGSRRHHGARFRPKLICDKRINEQTRPPPFEGGVLIPYVGLILRFVSASQQVVLSEQEKQYRTISRCASASSCCSTQDASMMLEGDLRHARKVTRKFIRDYVFIERSFPRLVPHRRDADPQESQYKKLPHRTPTRQPPGTSPNVTKKQFFILLCLLSYETHRRRSSSSRPRQPQRRHGIHSQAQSRADREPKSTSRHEKTEKGQEEEAFHRKRPSPYRVRQDRAGAHNRSQG